MQNLQNELINILQHEDALVVDGQLNKNKIVEMALQVDPKLIKHLIKHDTFKTHFFTGVEGVLVFDKIKFQRFVNNKSFLPDSYTAFKNKIGLTINDGTTDNYITTKNDVVLAWPHKDCVLEGGQIKEDQKRNEIFWNETLAPDEIDRLLDPKVFTNWKKYDQKGEHELTEISDNDNLIIKGNNLLALASLKKRYTGKVKLICIDPPYNKGGDDFNYNDSFNHATWLTFMKNRLLIAKDLLNKNGTIFIFCDDNEQPYLKVLSDEIFSRESFITTIVWRNSDNSNNDAKQFSQDHNYILVYSKNPKWESINLPRTEVQSKHYKNPDNDPRGPWFDGNPVNSPNPRKNLRYELIAPNGNKIQPPPNGWRWDKDTMKEKMDSGEIRFNSQNTGIIRRTYLEEQKDLPPSTLWEVIEENEWLNIDETGHTRQAKFEQKKLYPNIPTSELFKTPKPERVIQKIILISTYENDIVLDFFGGSGTTSAVAHKMKRRFITCEQMDYIHEFTIPRIQKVVGTTIKHKDKLLETIEFDNGGISKEVSWQGGGSFLYCELAKYNQTYADQILEADSKEKLIAVWQEMKEKAFLSYQFDKQSFDERIEAFKTLSLDDQKKFLLEVLDKNQLYVNYSEIADETFGISKVDKWLNDIFYGKIV
ncbi:MAG: site-specific DNA-methyltransferase [Bacteroidales bacterium]|nr:site-specific DNA-methyltransferase [Bacteroidales bacterium]